MGKIESGQVVEDVEEGEISDSASVEEISEADFNKQEQDSASGDSQSQRPKPESRVWTMRDLYNYPRFRTGLYNLAWAQAVQNKPLNEIFVMDTDPDDNARPSATDKVVIDVSGDEKEEGELEEGEIDLEEADQDQDQGASSCDASNAGSFDIDSRVNSVRDSLDSVNVIDAHKSFDQVCSRIHNALESLVSLLSESDFPAKKRVNPMLFSAVRVVNSVFCSMDLNQKDQERETLSRLLCSIKKCDPPLLTPEQMKETEIMLASLSPIDAFPNTKANDDEEKTQNIDWVQGMDFDFTAANTENSGHERTSVKWPSVASVVLSNKITPQEVVRPGASAYKGRGTLLPLLDLHKDHDEDSLPSPTRDAPPSFSVQKPLGIGDGTVKSVPAMSKPVTTEDSRLNRYETDAFKAVSTYQQKFGRSSFLMNDRLPSPTPSEEECDGGDDDIVKEVSSSFTGSNVRALSTPILRPPVVSYAHANISITAPVIGKNAAPGSASFNPTLKASAKSRDPRLRFTNSDSSVLDLNQRPLTAVPNAPIIDPSEPVSMKKQRTGEEPNIDGPASKRQKNAFENAGIAGDLKSQSGVGGWLEDNGATGPQLLSNNQFMDNVRADPRRSDQMDNCPTSNVLNAGKEQVLASGAANALPELLKDIAVNPEILINILKGQQQRLAAEAQQKSDPVKDAAHLPSANLILGPATLVNVAPSKALGTLQAPAGSHPITSVAGAERMQDEAGKIRMKPRDPRRILHGNSLQKNGTQGNEQFKTSGIPMPCTMVNKDNLNDPKMFEGQADRKQMPPQLVMPPDIARQFTKNLRNIADIVSVSSASTNPASVSQNLPSQPVPVKPDRGDVKPVVSNAEDQRNGTTTSSAEPTVEGASRSPNAWGDVEHLFEGYDDLQKAAIQRERARRLEEQKKMFEARKLCLVLDLDHTLLNSAKFVEVDQMHDDILRKKEEQDREKPQRHLFRFPHMGMWTKLRPGIWNFLEKVSKLFELHLYTMGNKLYATEMAKVLDPKGTLFAGRVISKGDDEDPFDGDERVPKSKDLEGVLGMESAVVIIDDSVRVWPHNKLNLIVVERYIYFPCSRRQFGLPGPSLLEIDHDERPEEGTLASSLSVIERIHQNFFSHQSLDEADVRNILASEQQKILAGCRIVFSRVFPVSEVNPHLHPLWQTAEQFGAVCTTQIDDLVTHVVANSPGTDKVNWALSNGKFAVHPGWVEASALLYRRANEQDFAIKPSPP